MINFNGDNIIMQRAGVTTSSQNCVRFIIMGAQAPRASASRSRLSHPCSDDIYF